MSDMATHLGGGYRSPPIAELWVHEPQWWSQISYLTGVWMAIRPFAEFSVFFPQTETRTTDNEIE